MSSCTPNTASGIYTNNPKKEIPVLMVGYLFLNGIYIGIELWNDDKLQKHRVLTQDKQSATSIP